MFQSDNINMSNEKNHIKYRGSQGFLRRLLS